MAAEIKSAGGCEPISEEDHRFALEKLKQVTAGLLPKHSTEAKAAFGVVRNHLKQSAESLAACLDLIAVSYHEAGHAVITYRATGFAGGETSIIPDAEKGTLGHSADYLSDSTNHSDAESFILSTYAGGHAQRRIQPAAGDEGCQRDDEMASEILEQWGWKEREAEFRKRSLDLVERHWPEIEAVALELTRSCTLDNTEVELIADAAVGDATPAALAGYRALKAINGL